MFSYLLDLIGAVLKHGMHGQPHNGTKLYKILLTKTSAFVYKLNGLKNTLLIACTHNKAAG